jgi:hypothetical protein
MDESGKERRRPKCSRDACSAGRWPDLAGGATDNTNSILTHSTYMTRISIRNDLQRWKD